MIVLFSQGGNTNGYNGVMTIDHFTDRELDSTCRGRVFKSCMKNDLYIYMELLGCLNVHWAGWWLGRSVP